jgi:hypothetical protein
VGCTAPALQLLQGLAADRRPQDRLFLTAAVGRAGLDPDATFYSLRHASITRMKATVPTQAVAAHHGTSARIIEANYAKFVPADRARYAALGALTVDRDPRPAVDSPRSGGRIGRPGDGNG